MAVFFHRLHGVWVLPERRLFRLTKVVESSVLEEGLLLVQVCVAGDREEGRREAAAVS